MKVKVTKGFQDVVAGHYRNFGDVFEVDENRLKTLKGYVEAIDKPKQEKERAIHATK